MPTAVRLWLPSVSVHVVAKTRDTGQEPFVFQHAQRLAAGGPGVPVLLAEAGDGRRGLAGFQSPVSDLLAHNRGQAHVCPWVSQACVSRGLETLLARNQVTL